MAKQPKPGSNGAQRKAQTNGQPLKYQKQKYDAPSADSPFWKTMIGEAQLQKYRYKPPLNHPFRVPPRYIPADAEAVFEPPRNREPTDEERIILALDKGIEDFRDFTSNATSLFRAYVEMPEEEDDDHALDLFDDDERSVLIRTIFDNVQALLKLPCGGFGGFIAGTAYRLQRWALEGNDILAKVSIGWSECLSAAPWAPDSEREYCGRDGKITPRRPQPATMRRMLQEASDEIQPWLRVRHLHHRLSVCAQILTDNPANLAPPADSKLPLPASYFKDAYCLSPDCLAKAFAEKRLKFAVKKGGRWYYREDEVLALWPQKK